MFYIHINYSRWDSPASKPSGNFKFSPPEESKDKSSQFAKKKTTEYICNIQQNYYLERRLFS